jgi:hypothetical protein
VLRAVAHPIEVAGDRRDLDLAPGRWRILRASSARKAGSQEQAESERETEAC